MLDRLADKTAGDSNNSCTRTRPREWRQRLQAKVVARWACVSPRGVLPPVRVCQRGHQAGVLSAMLALVSFN